MFVMQIWRGFKYKAIIGLIIGLSCLVSACDKNAKKKSMPEIPAPAMKLQISQVPLIKEYIGTSESVAEVGIRARVKGFLDKVNFVEGKPVLKDQLLFVIEPNSFQAKVDLAKGDLLKAEAEQAFQKVELERMKQLVSKGNISKERYDRTRAQYLSAQGDVQSAKANLEEAKINLSYTSMYAPFDGLIGEKFVDVGNLVGGADETLLANVIQLNPLYVSFNPSVDDYAQMLKYRSNMPFRVVATMPKDSKQRFDGKLELINNLADVDTSTILMRATVKNPDNLALPGMYMRVQVYLTDKHKVLLVPETAVINDQGQQTVLLVNEQSIVESQKIETIGEFKQQFIVESGIKAGDVIIIEGQQKLKPGMKVKPMMKQDG